MSRRRNLNSPSSPIDVDSSSVAESCENEILEELSRSLDKEEEHDTSVVYISSDSETEEGAWETELPPMPEFNYVLLDEV